MGVKITDLPSASNSNNNDLLAIVQNGETKNVQKAVLIESVNNNIADEYSTASTYGVGDCCIYQGQLYVCVTAIPTAEEWNASHWQQVNLSEEIKNKLSTKVNQSQILNENSSSQENAYCCNYINNLSVLTNYYNQLTNIYPTLSEVTVSLQQILKNTQGLVVVNINFKTNTQINTGNTYNLCTVPTEIRTGKYVPMSSVKGNVYMTPDGLIRFSPSENIPVNGEIAVHGVYYIQN